MSTPSLPSPTSDNMDETDATATMTAPTPEAPVSSGENRTAERGADVDTNRTRRKASAVDAGASPGRLADDSAGDLADVGAGDTEDPDVDLSVFTQMDLEEAVVDDTADDDEPDDSEREARTIITEALGAKLSSRALLGAVSAVLGFTLVFGALGALTSNTPSVSADIPGAEAPIHTADALDTPTLASHARDVVYRVQTETNQGSSFLIGPSLLVTNAHVAGDQGDTVDVQSNDGAKFEGTVVAADVALDLALVKIPEQDVEPVDLVGSEDQSVGQQVVIAGYPIGLNFSITTGTAAAIDQVTNLKEGHAQAGLLQLDATVNPGDSGGPVLSADGRVMGMTTFRPDQSGDRPVQGIAFAVTANDISIALQQWREWGDIQYGYLGVSLNGASRDGAIVESVTGTSPAAAAGIKEGDVIVAVGERATLTYVDVSRQLRTYRPGETVRLSIERDGKPRSVDVTMGSYRG